MNREELERLTKPELIDLLLGLQRPDKTSRTSSNPPSTDRKGKREGSRPGGAKPGHKGHARALAETADAHEDHRSAHCQYCGLPFVEDAMGEVIGEYDEIDLPEVKPIIRRVIAHPPIFRERRLSRGLGGLCQTGRGIGWPARVSRMASMARTDRLRPVSTAVRTSA